MGSGRRFAGDERGSTAIVFALALLPVMAAAGAALDYSRASQMRTKLQAVIDAAVLTGLKASSTQRAATAESYVRSALAPRNVAIDQLAFTPTASQGLRGRVKVRMTSLFGNILGTNGIAVAAGSEGFVRAAAAAGGNVCLMLMDPSAAETLRVNGGATVKAPNCEVHVHTSANVGAVFNGNATFDVKRICLKGSGYIANGSPKLGPIEKNCAVAADPYAGAFAPPSLACTRTDAIFNAPKGKTATELEPGVYCGNTVFNGNHDIKLKPGLYVIKDGAMTVNGGSSISGADVTFYLANAQSSLQLNGNATTQLSAPTAASAPYPGVLMLEPSGLPRSSIAINGGSGHQLKGLLYLPSRNVTFNGASTVDGDNVTMVFNALTVNGGGGTEWRFDTAAKTIMAPSSSGTAEIILRY
jgi:Flp pilus assembly protein TadG